MKVCELIRELQSLQPTDEVSVGCMGNELAIVDERGEEKIIKL